MPRGEYIRLQADLMLLAGESIPRCCNCLYMVGPLARSALVTQAIVCTAGLKKCRPRLVR